jgi:heme O synthase-like polyprenyltransferase
MDFSEQVLRNLAPPFGRKKGGIMIVFMVAMLLLAVFVGAVAFVSSPVGLVLAAVIAAWLLIYSVRSLLARSRHQEARRG